MIKLTDQMRREIDPALAQGCPCVVATVSKDGVPNVGYKGSMMVFDDTSLAYWERTLRARSPILRRTRTSWSCSAIPPPAPPGAFWAR